jgi:acetyl esterase/lipase
MLSLGSEMRRHYRSNLSPSAFLRLTVGAVSTGLASLAVVEARTWDMLVLTVGVTEWGHVVAPLGLAALLPGWRRERAARLGAALGVLAAALSLSSLARARRMARGLPALLAAELGDTPPRRGPGAPPRPAPLVARDVLLGVRSPAVRRDRFVYAARDELALALDLYRPARQAKDETREPHPCVVVVHGGSWHYGDSGQLPRLNRYLAARGYAVAAISYRLAPHFRFPAPRDDVLSAIEFLKANAAELGIDPRKIVLLGRSAGGHLALLAAYTADDPAIRGVIALYAPTDLLYGYDHPARKRIMDGIPLVENFLGGPPSTIRDRYAFASPTSHTTRDCPPTLLIHGGRDNLVAPAHSERLAERLKAAGCMCVYMNLPWATHGGDTNFTGPTGQVSTYAIERFLAAVTSS